MSTGRDIDLGPVLDFLHCRTPVVWAQQAVLQLDLLLADHAALELKAAQQAQKLIWKYGTGRVPELAEDERFGSRLVQKMSRLAREELRHFEQVIALTEKRGWQFRAISSSRYASSLHEQVRRTEPGALVDQLIIGAIIEARSCERFYSLLEPMEDHDPELAAFYASLLRSEARHFSDYLALAQSIQDPAFEARLEQLLALDAELVQSADSELRFHSGPLSESKREPHPATDRSSQSQVLSPARS